MPFCELEDGLRLNYELSGTGPELVFLIMGLGSSLLAWEDTVNGLTGSSIDREKYTVCAYDNRGMGMSDCNTIFIRYTTQTLAHDALTLLRHLKWTEKGGINLVGISMGGMISLELVHAYPKLFKSLTLISTTAGRTITPWFGAVTTVRAIFITDPKQKVDLVLRMLFHKNYLTRKAEKEGFASMEDQVTHEFLKRRERSRPPALLGQLGQISAVLTHHVSKERLADIRSNKALKILVVTGTWDNLVRPENSYFLAEQLNARLEIFQDSGHVLITDSRDKFNALLKEHIEASNLVQVSIGDE